MNKMVKVAIIAGGAYALSELMFATGKGKALGVMRDVMPDEIDDLTNRMSKNGWSGKLTAYMTNYFAKNFEQKMRNKTK